MKSLTANLRAFATRISCVLRKLLDAIYVDWMVCNETAKHDAECGTLRRVNHQKFSDNARPSTIPVDATGLPASVFGPLPTIALDPNLLMYGGAALVLAFLLRGGQNTVRKVGRYRSRHKKRAERKAELKEQLRRL